MVTFNSINKAPGVYVQEITLPGPIPGVSTSNAAFVGPAAMGPLFKPTLLTNFDQFSALFGGYVEDPYRVYVTHAVKGFFDEGGSVCYFVRVGKGVQATLNLLDGKGRSGLVVTALKEGVAGNNIKVQLKASAAPLASTKAAFVKVNIPAGNAAPNQRTVKTASDTDAAKFKPGDVVFLEGGGNSERATIASITKDAAAPSSTFTMVSNLTQDYGTGTMRVADLIPGQNKIRVLSAVGLEPGSYITVTQGAVTENAVVRVADQIGSFISLDKPLANNYPLGAVDVTIVSKEFDLTIQAPGNPDETPKNLSIDPRHSRFFKGQVASASTSIDFADPPTPTAPPDDFPADQNTIQLGTAGQGTAGADENLKALQAVDYNNGIDTLKKVLDVNLLCVPDAVTDAIVSNNPLFAPADTQAIQAHMVAHCEKLQDRFAILDSRRLGPGDITGAGVVAQRQNLNSDNGYAALYFPWIAISNPFGKGRIFVPPSGYAAGVFAKNDDDVGVYKAPANEPITSALSLEFTTTDDEQGPLNEAGINVIRSFPGQGIKIWGARTIAPHDVTAWRFVNVRRLTTFIEKSIQEGTRFAVFQPNNLTLWQQIKRMVTDFLTQQWVDGALFGDTAEHAFRVRVDETINPPSITALGQLIVQVTIRPTTPAEFIVFQVIQDITGSTLQESTAA